jgi:hypothetical protein
MHDVFMSRARDSEPRHLSISVHAPLTGAHIVHVEAAMHKVNTVWGFWIACNWVGIC